MSPANGRQTRKPTGLPPWPIVLLTGVQGSGKTYKAAEATGSELVGRTFWIGVGENDPDEYGKVPGADFDIVSHDGTYRDLLAALAWASAHPRVDGKPALLIVDSFGRGWDLLSDMAQAEANRRRKDPTGEAKIASDLWNLAGQRWAHLLDVLREHDGPVLVTARLERQTVFSEDGNPTKDKHNKVKAQKGLPFDVDVVVEFPDPYPAGARITKARSLTFTADPARELNDFTLDKLWRALGMAEPGGPGTRQHATVVIADGDPDTAERARTDLLDLCQERGWVPRDVVAEYAATHPDAPALNQDDDVERLRSFVRAKSNQARVTDSVAGESAT